MLMYVIGALKPDVVDPEIQFLANCTRKQWPLLVALQLYRAEWPRDRSIPSRLLHAACPALAKVLITCLAQKVEFVLESFLMASLAAGPSCLSLLVILFVSITG